MNVHNQLYDQIILTSVEIGGQMYHAREEGGEIKLVVDASTKQPIPVWVCICQATKFEDCVCGAWEMHQPVVDEWISDTLWLPPQYKEYFYNKGSESEGDENH